MFPLAALLGLIVTLFALAQADIPVDPETLNLTSIGAIVTATLLIVQYLVKPLGTKVPAFDRIPTIIYVLGIAGFLTWFANRVLRTLPGDNVSLLVVKAVTMGLASQGLYVIKRASAPLETTCKPDGVGRSGGPTPAIAYVLLFLTLWMVGCNATSSPFYNGVAAQWPPIRETYNRGVDADPSNTPQQRKILHDSAASMDDLIAREGKRLSGVTAATTQP